ncbi:MAG TPA: hypothetical protein VFJ62_14425 [Usitatibacter sp.]|nr:hypothetical protein [Usitatibacter sp.]
MSKVSNLRELVELTGAQLESGLKSLPRDKGAPRLTTAVCTLAAEEINKSLAQVDVAGMLAHGWARARALRDAANASLASPGKPALATLGEHDLRYTCTPVLQMISGDAALPEIRFTVELVAHFKAAEMAVVDGRLASVAPGSASVVARVKCGNTTLAEKTTPNARLSSTIRLDPALEIG